MKNIEENILDNPFLPPALALTQTPRIFQQTFSGGQIFLTLPPTLKGYKNFNPKIFFDTKSYLALNFFGPKKLFLTQNFSNKKILGPKQNNFSF